MIIDWPDGFDQYLDRLKSTVAAGDRRARLLLDRVLAELVVLQDLDGEPVEETATLKQSANPVGTGSGGWRTPSMRRLRSG